MNGETKKKIRFLGRIFFVLYLMALVYMLLLSEGYGRIPKEHREYRYNLVLFREISRFWVHRQSVGLWASFLNIGGNVIGFLPFGFVLPIMHRNLKSFWLVTLLGGSFSLLVETVQLIFKVGSFDVDDLFLNTIGAALGYLLFIICNRIRRLCYEKI